MKSKRLLMIFLKGIGMGAADIVPGVSGGTIAFITGIYQELVDTIKGFVPAFVMAFRKKTLRGLWKNINGNFIVALIAGIAIAFVLLSKLISDAINNHTITTQAFFFGLIIASIIIIFRNERTVIFGKAKIDTKTKAVIGQLSSKQHKTKVVSNVLFGLLGVVLALLLPESTSLNGPEDVPYLYLFVCAMISICAMILPGISGSFVLVLLGCYNAFLSAIHEPKIAALAVFILGALIGLIAFSSLLSLLLKKAYSQTITLLTGFIIGSLNIIWPWKANVLEGLFTANAEGIPMRAVSIQNVLPQEYETLTALSYQPQQAYLAEALIAAAAGIVLVIGIEIIAKKIKK